MSIRSIFAPSQSRSKWRVEEGEAAIDEPQPLPHAVAEHEAGIEDGDLRLIAGRQRAIDADEDGIVARVADIVLRSGGELGWIRHDLF